MNHQELLSRSGTGVGMSGGDQASNLTVHITSIAIIWSAVHYGKKRGVMVTNSEMTHKH